MAIQNKVHVPKGCQISKHETQYTENDSCEARGRLMMCDEMKSRTLDSCRMRKWMIFRSPNFNGTEDERGRAGGVKRVVDELVLLGKSIKQPNPDGATSDGVGGWDCENGRLHERCRILVSTAILLRL
jgi:hypothetical protein